MRTPSSLEEAIYRTVCWFSLFDYPLTAFEIWKWLYVPQGVFALADVYVALQDSAWLSQRVQRASGFFARRGGTAVEELVATRHERFLDAMRKFGKLQRVARWFATIPAVEGIAAVNTLAWWNTKPESDIDLYIVVKPGRIWSTRFMLVTPFAVMGMRPGNRSQDPFCFSFFCTSERLALKDLQIENDDPYLAFWSRSLMPLYDRGNVFKQFVQQNTWAADALPNSSDPRPHPYLAIKKTITLPCQAHFIEGFYRRMQKKRFPETIKAMMNQDSRVVVDDGMLKFHENDRRQEYRDAFLKLTRV
jgi:hypothetical protein